MGALHKLTHLQIRNAPPGKYNDGAGLWLVKRADGGAQWVLRLSVHGRRREMGLGPLSEVSLKEARGEAEKWRGVARSGKDPIKERNRLRREAARDENTLGVIAASAFEARKAELKEDGKACHRQQGGDELQTHRLSRSAARVDGAVGPACDGAIGRFRPGFARGLGLALPEGSATRLEYARNETFDLASATTFGNAALVGRSPAG